MQLEWFRTHKQFVYWVLLPIVGLGMAFFGLTTAMDDSGRNKGGPSINFPDLQSKSPLSSSEVFNSRLLLTHFDNDLYRPINLQSSERIFNPANFNVYRVSQSRDPRHVGRATSDEVLVHEVALHQAQASGFELGAKEAKDATLRMIKYQIRRKDNTPDAPATEENYRKLLQVLQLSSNQFERLTYEHVLQEKYVEHLLRQANWNSGEVYVAFAQDKEVARLRFREFKSEDFLAKVEAITDDKIVAWYDANKDPKVLEEQKKTLDNLRNQRMQASFQMQLAQDNAQREEARRSLREIDRYIGFIERRVNKIETLVYSKPRMTAEVLFLDPAKIIAGLKPTDEQLKKYFEDYGQVWPNKKFEEVKTEVEKRWLETERTHTTRAKVIELTTQLREAEDKHAKEQEALPEAQRKPFDIAAWGKDKDITVWTTAEHTQDEFKAGKPDVNAADSKWAAKLFDIPRDGGNVAGLKQFSYPEFVDAAKPEQGLVSVRMKTLKEREVLPLDQVRAGIAEHLKVVRAVELAQAEAKRVQEAWAGGAELPTAEDVEKFEEVAGNSESEHPLLRTFHADPKVVGEVIPVAGSVPSMRDTQMITQHEKFFVGFAVERKLPNLDGFTKNTDFNREAVSSRLQDSHQWSMGVTLVERFKTLGKVVGPAGSDPDLFDEGRGR